MKVDRIGAALVASLTMCGALAAAAEHVVEIQLRGRYYSAPATIRVNVAVEPDASNRTLVVEADGERLFRSSELTLEGDREQRLHTIEFKNLPAGHYVLRAEVRSDSNVRGVAEELLVVGDPGDQP